MKRLLSSWFIKIMILAIIFLSIVFPIISHISLQKGTAKAKLQTDKIIHYDGEIISCANINGYEYEHLIDHIDLKTKLEKSEFTTSNTMAIEMLSLLIDQIIKESIYATRDYRRDLHLSHLLPYRDSADLLLHKYALARVINQESAGIDLAFEFLQKDYMSRDVEEYRKLSKDELMKLLSQMNEALEMFDKVILNDDYKAYYHYTLSAYHREIDHNFEEIKQLEKDLDQHSDEPSQYKDAIQYRQRYIKEYEAEIPLIQYCIDHDIPPSDSDWRYRAIQHKRQHLHEIIYVQQVSRDEFENDHYLRQEYRSYMAYTQAQQEKINAHTKEIHIIDHSLLANQPDMKFCYVKSRYCVTDYLWYSIVIAIFAIILGSTIISKEHEVGTIRLWVIRPKTRTKLLLSRFFAIFILCFILYTITTILSIVNFGILKGFDDYAHPIFKPFSKQGVPFFADFTVKYLACSLSILFACSLACFMSSASKNTSIAVALSLVLFIGLCFLSLYVIGSYEYTLSQHPWLLYTPIPYVNMNFIFHDDYVSLLPPLSYGYTLMITLSGTLIAGAVFAFKRQDI